MFSNIVIKMFQAVMCLVCRVIKMHGTTIKNVRCIFYCGFFNFLSLIMCNCVILCRISLCVFKTQQMFSWPQISIRYV